MRFGGFRVLGGVLCHPRIPNSAPSIRKRLALHSTFTLCRAVSMFVSNAHVHNGYGGNRLQTPPLCPQGYGLFYRFLHFFASGPHIILQKKAKKTRKMAIFRPPGLGKGGVRYPRKWPKIGFLIRFFCVGLKRGVPADPPKLAKNVILPHFPQPPIFGPFSAIFAHFSGYPIRPYVIDGLCINKVLIKDLFVIYNAIGVLFIFV